MGVTAEDIFRIINQLPVQEMKKFSDMVNEQMLATYFPWLIQQARDVCRRHPDASDEELYSLINEESKRAIEVYEQTAGERAAAQLKQARDRKPDPETILRNVEICNLRKQNKKVWSLKKLATKYDVTVQRIAQILKKEPAWRRQAQSLNPSPIGKKSSN
jgi:hypothetical protein